jgi:cardiolipin synthase
MLELNGPVVDAVRKDFEKTWVRHMFMGDLLAPLKVVRPVNNATEDMYPVRVLTTSPHDAQILKAQIAAIRQSQQRIYIQNAYFTSDAILYELVMARRRGVDVRVILPLSSDSGLIDRANAIAANKMIANGIRVYIYPGMSHVKGAIYDGWACLGSANFDALSLQVNRELNIATSHSPVVAELLQRVFLADMAKSVELTEPFPREWWDFLTGLIADIL